jgi:hypothetical protein
MLQAHEDYAQGYYLGVVTNVNDPLDLMRIQCKVPGLYDPDLGDVPWCGPIKDSPFGFGSGYGVYGYPQMGSTVLIELQGGDEHKPLYRTIPTAQDPNGNFSGPNQWGFQDPSGNILVVDMAAGTWKWQHSSGDYVTYDKTGKMNVYAMDNVSVTSKTRIDVQAPLITFNTEPVI